MTRTNTAGTSSPAPPSVNARRLEARELAAPALHEQQQPRRRRSCRHGAEQRRAWHRHAFDQSEPYAHDSAPSTGMIAHSGRELVRGIRSRPGPISSATPRIPARVPPAPAGPEGRRSGRTTESSAIHSGMVDQHSATIPRDVRLAQRGPSRCQRRAAAARRSPRAATARRAGHGRTGELGPRQQDQAASSSRAPHSSSGGMLSSAMRMARNVPPQTRYRQRESQQQREQRRVLRSSATHALLPGPDRSAAPSAP